MTFEQLNNRHVYSLHFNPSDFNNINLQQRLPFTTIPFKYDFFESPDLHVKIPTKTYNKGPQITLNYSPAILNKTQSSVNLSNECSSSTHLMIQSFIDIPSPVNTNKNLNKSGIILFPTETNPTTLNNKLKDQIRKKNVLLKNKLSTISKLKKKLKIKHKLKSNITFSSLGSKVFAEMQMFRKHNSKLPWKLSEKNFAINLYYKSSTT
jgi:hypothetical protein